MNPVWHRVNFIPWNELEKLTATIDLKKGKSFPGTARLRLEQKASGSICAYL